jgi:hypothetical protein
MSHGKQAHYSEVNLGLESKKAHNRVRLIFLEVFCKNFTFYRNWLILASKKDPKQRMFFRMVDYLLFATFLETKLIF